MAELEAQLAQMDLDEIKANPSLHEAAAKAKELGQALEDAQLKAPIAGYIVPFMFAYGPSLLLIGSFWEVALTVATALVGVASLAVGVSGYLFCTLTIGERALAVVAAMLLIAPSVQLILPGLALMALLALIQWKRKQKASAGAPVPARVGGFFAGARVLYHRV